MKTRRRITRHIRNSWIESFEKMNRLSKHYISFIKCQDLISSGAKNRTPDYQETGNDFDLLSLNEHFFYLQLLRDPRITWIKEQYPLLPIERAISIAKTLGVRYPTYPYSDSVEVVMTVDFYCGTIFGYDVAYSIKDAADIEQLSKATKRVKSNFENKQLIERVFHESKKEKCKWFLISSDCIKTIYSENLQRLAPYIILKTALMFYLASWLMCFKSYLGLKQQLSLADLLQTTATDMQLEYTDVISMFNHSLWHDLIKTDLNKKINFENEVSEIKLVVKSVK
jgi:hypothetical protein